MAKQKLKLPLKRAARRAADPAAVPGAMPAKRKAKDVGKVKAKGAGALLPVEGSLAAVPIKRLLKRKLQRRKGVPPDVVPVVAPLDLPARTDERSAPPPTTLRPRKARPGAPLGRLERLEIAIGEVRIGGRASARTRKLLAAGVPKMAQKVIEEAAEVAIEAIRGEQGAFVHETVDLFYNLLALCSEIGVPLTAVWAEMDRREQTLGMAEKLPKGPEL